MDYFFFLTAGSGFFIRIRIRNPARNTFLTLKDSSNFRRIRRPVFCKLSILKDEQKMRKTFAVLISSKLSFLQFQGRRRKHLYFRRQKKPILLKKNLITFFLFFISECRQDDSLRSGADIRGVHCHGGTTLNPNKIMFT